MRHIYILPLFILILSTSSIYTANIETEIIKQVREYSDIYICNYTLRYNETIYGRIYQYSLGKMIHEEQAIVRNIYTVEAKPNTTHIHILATDSYGNPHRIELSGICGYNPINTTLHRIYIEVGYAEIYTGNGIYRTPRFLIKLLSSGWVYIGNRSIYLMAESTLDYYGDRLVIYTGYDTLVVRTPTEIYTDVPIYITLHHIETS